MRVQSCVRTRTLRLQASFSAALAAKPKIKDAELTPQQQLGQRVKALLAKGKGAARLRIQLSERIDVQPRASPLSLHTCTFAQRSRTTCTWSWSPRRCSGSNKVGGQEE